MKRVYVACILIVLFAKIASAQSARVNVVIVNTPVFSAQTSIVDPLAKFKAANNGGSNISFNSNHTGSYTINLGAPQTVSFSSYFSSVKNKPADKFFWYALFLTPGDDLTIKIDPNKPNNNLVITGIGSNNNQPGLLELTGMDTQPFKKDETPQRVIAAINKQSVRNKAILNKYALQFKKTEIMPDKPSEACIRNAWMNQAYFAARIYYEFDHNNNFAKPEAYLRKWRKVQDSLFRTIKLNNDEALEAFNYQQLITDFLLREKERLWIQQRNHPGLFYKEWYHTTDAAKGKKLFSNEQTSLLVEKIINRYFTGKTAEYLYNVLLKRNLDESDYQNITVLFEHFKQKYPGSKYIAQFSRPINDVIKKQSLGLNKKMIFVANNGAKLNTLKDVLALTKGKTVFVDMWGTWCGACREEIEKNSAALETYFKGKNVLFLYIANKDSNQEQEWKKLIAYYQLEGTHILANDKLTADIMNKTKSSGFPTYFIIKKDGAYELSKAGYPMNRGVLIKQLEAALSQ